MTIALAKDVEDYLQKQVRHGVCADAAVIADRGAWINDRGRVDGDGHTSVLQRQRHASAVACRKVGGNQHFEGA